MIKNKIKNKFYARILLNLINKWHTSSFFVYSDSELELLNILTIREIASKDNDSFSLKYSITEFTNRRKTPLDFEELELLEAVIEDIESKKSHTFTILNIITNSKITKLETKILFELIDIEIHKNRVFISQKELLEFYNKKHFNTLDHLDSSIKQSHISRALKNLIEQEFVYDFKIKKEKLYSVNWNTFSI